MQAYHDQPTASHAKQDNNSSTRRATIGVLCVDTEFQKQGVGVGLVCKCQEVAATVWNETELFAEVEPKNVDALAFFETKCGFSNNETVLKSSW